MSVKLAQHQICNAASFEAWSFSLWGMPKASVICGNCRRPFTSRDYAPFNRGKSDEGVAANCPHCGKWNVARGIVFA